MAIATLYAGLTSPVIGGGSGGTPPAGDGSIWIEPDFAALDALTGVDDGDIGVTENNGWIYSRQGGVWEFFLGNVDQRANLPSAPIAGGAICSAGTMAEQDRVYFVYDGAAWQRSPDLTGYIWPDVATSANLPTAERGLETGDRCTTTDTGFVWEYNGADWEQVYGTVSTVANLPSVDVAGSALFGVGTDGVHERIWYGRHAGNWIRTPESIDYTFPVAATPAALRTDALENGDLQRTTSPNRLWERVSGAWRIRQATESAAASLPTTDVITGALGFVGNAVYVRGASTWDRSGVTLNQPYARTLSSLQDVLTTDLDGDYGTFGGAVLRLKRSISLPGGGTVNLWVPPVVYAGTITMRAYLTGGESNTGLNTTLGNQGWTVSTTGSGTINTTTAAGYVTITDNNTASSSASIAVTALTGTLAASTKYYIQGALRIPLSTGPAYAPSVRDGANNWSLYQTNAGYTLAADASVPPTSISSGYIRDGRTAMPTSGAASVIEVIDEGASVMTMVRRDGAPYVATRRSLVGAAATANIFFGDLSGVTTGVTLQLQNLYLLTWV